MSIAGSICNMMRALSHANTIAGIAATTAKLSIATVRRAEPEQLRSRRREDGEHADHDERDVVRPRDVVVADDARDQCAEDHRPSDTERDHVVGPQHHHDQREAEQDEERRHRREVMEGVDLVGRAEELRDRERDVRDEHEHTEDARDDPVREHSAS